MITPGLLWQRRHSVERKGGGGGCSNSSARLSATAIHNYHSRLFGVPSHLRRAAAAAVVSGGGLVNLLIDGRGREDLPVGGVLLGDGLVGRALCVTVGACTVIKKKLKNYVNVRKKRE